MFDGVSPLHNVCTLCKDLCLYKDYARGPGGHWQIAKKNIYEWGSESVHRERTLHDQWYVQMQTFKCRPTSVLGRVACLKFTPIVKHIS